MYIPKDKFELINCLCNCYPDDRKKFWKWNKKRLYAMFYKVRGK